MVVAESDEWLDLFTVFFTNVKEVIQEKRVGRADIFISANQTQDETIISIEDDAGGINEELLPSKLFEAYMTTSFKSRDKGLGL